VARAVLQPAAEHLGQQLTATRSTLPAELHNPLNQLGGVPYFALSRRSFLGGRALCAKLTDVWQLTSKSRECCRCASRNSQATCSSAAAGETSGCLPLPSIAWP
jgi:hypothetical protein